MYDDPTVVALVTAARDGDREAWDQIVERYAPLVWAICRRHRLGPIDADDVGQNVWLKLYEHLGDIRNPAALPGWLARTTQNECLHNIRAAGRQGYPQPFFEAEVTSDGEFEAVDEELDREQRRIALRQAFEQLRPLCRALLALLFSEERPPYRLIGTRLNMKVGSIGPTRERCLDELRRSPALVALAAAERQEGAESNT